MDIKEVCRKTRGPTDHEDQQREDSQKDHRTNRRPRAQELKK